MLLNKKWIVRESNAPSLRRGNKFKFYIRKILVSYATVIVSNSKSGFDYWNSEYPNKCNKLIENGFPIKTITQQIGNEALPEWINNSVEKQHLLFVGRLELQKNLHVDLRYLI